jgi:hypothetical protein
VERILLTRAALMIRSATPIGRIGDYPVRNPIFIGPDAKILPQIREISWLCVTYCSAEALGCREELLHLGHDTSRGHVSGSLKENIYIFIQGGNERIPGSEGSVT